MQILFIKNDLCVTLRMLSLSRGWQEGEELGAESDVSGILILGLSPLALQATGVPQGPFVGPAFARHPHRNAGEKFFNMLCSEIFNKYTLKFLPHLNIKIASHFDR